MPDTTTIPQISVCSTPNCDKVNIFDTTGAYSPTNTAGWGLPNIPITDVTAAVLNVSIYEPNTGQFTPSTVLNVDVSSKLPNLAGIPYQMLLSDFGFGQPGIYYITVTYTANDNEYLAEFYYLDYCEYECCYKKKAEKSGDCKCKSDDELFLIWTYLQLLKANRGCAYNLNWISDILKKLKKLCADCGCGCK